MFSVRPFLLFSQFNFSYNYKQCVYSTRFQTIFVRSVQKKGNERRQFEHEVPWKRSAYKLMMDATFCSRSKLLEKYSFYAKFNSTNGNLAKRFKVETFQFLVFLFQFIFTVESFGGSKCLLWDMIYCLHCLLWRIVHVRKCGLENAISLRFARRFLSALQMVTKYINFVRDYLNKWMVIVMEHELPWIMFAYAKSARIFLFHLKYKCSQLITIFHHLRMWMNSTIFHHEKTIHKYW